MKPTPHSIRHLAPGLLAGLFAVAAAALAQTAPATSNVAAKSDDTVTLSPFEVRSDQDTGYTATNTLAGSRLNTPIKDLGSAISVYTKEFMEDIGATSINDLLMFNPATPLDFLDYTLGQIDLVLLMST